MKSVGFGCLTQIHGMEPRLNSTKLPFLLELHGSELHRFDYTRFCFQSISQSTNQVLFIVVHGSVKGGESQTVDPLPRTN